MPVLNVRPALFTRCNARHGLRSEMQGTADFDVSTSMRFNKNTTSNSHTNINTNANNHVSPVPRPRPATWEPGYNSRQANGMQRQVMTDLEVRMFLSVWDFSVSFPSTQIHLIDIEFFPPPFQDGWKASSRFWWTRVIYEVVEQSKSWVTNLFRCIMGSRLEDCELTNLPHSLRVIACSENNLAWIGNCNTR